jgi:RNA polymerase sigma factor (sigma-70 family)
MTLPAADLAPFFSVILRVSEINHVVVPADTAEVTAQSEDDSLLAGVCAGDGNAFSAVFDAHALVVHRYLARRCADRDQAEDLTSVVFLEAWRARARATIVDGSLRPWLLAIARNVARNANRSQRRHRAALDRLHALPLPPAADDHAETAADSEALRATLAAAIAQLTDKQRDVVELCLVEQLSAVAAADVLGIPSGTVKSRLADARTRLRQLLRPSELEHLTDPGSDSGHQPGERHNSATAGRTAASWTR